MADRKKVINALELCANGCDNDGCVYFEEQNRHGGLAKCRCVDLLARDALALLKEQEAEITFLKEMQLQTVHNMSNEDIGNAVRNVLRL